MEDQGGQGDVLFCLQQAQRDHEHCATFQLFTAFHTNKFTTSQKLGMPAVGTTKRARGHHEEGRLLQSCPGIWLTVTLRHALKKTKIRRPHLRPTS